MEEKGATSATHESQATLEEVATWGGASTGEGFACAAAYLAPKEPSKATYVSRDLKPSHTTTSVSPPTICDGAMRQKTKDLFQAVEDKEGGNSQRHSKYWIYSTVCTSS